MTKLSFFKKEKNDDSTNGKRDKDFEAELSGLYIDRLSGSYGDRTLISFEFGKLLPLTIGIAPEKMVKDPDTGAITPAPGSNAYALLSSMADLGIEVEIDFDNDEINTNPSLVGKMCKFCCTKKPYNRQLTGSARRAQQSAEQETYNVWKLFGIRDI